METLLAFKEMKKRQMIEEYQLDITERDLEQEYREPTFSEGLIKRYKYNWKYHLNEIFNRVLCQEQNKPDTHEIRLLN